MKFETQTSCNLMLVLWNPFMILLWNF